MNDLISLTARDAVAALINREVSSLELIDAAEARLDEVDGAVNALPTRCFDRARRATAALPDREDPPPGWLYGLPVAIKDLNDVAGVATTYGSRVYASHVPSDSDFTVQRLEANGAVVVAKSNTPEFGAGSHTFNDVFGHTRNPFDLTKSAGGSSGGAAAALATGQVWLANGGDLGGSLRNPASFCGVVGLRPSPGRVAAGPRPDPWNTLSVQGPMGRTVGDVALMLDAMVGLDRRDPLSIPAPRRSFTSAADEPQIPQRVAYSPDLGGITPVDPEVAAVCERAARRFEDFGTTVVEDTIDFTGAKETFHVLRARGFATSHSDLLAHRDLVKEEVVWNVEAGLRLTVDEITAAITVRGELLYRTTRFFETYDLLLCPAAIVPPFPSEQRWPRVVAGIELEHYIDWLLICSAITLTSCPAISVPAGFTAAGLPVGLQMVGRPRGEHRLLAAAAAFEAAHGPDGQVPLTPAPHPPSGNRSVTS